MEMQRSTNTS